MAVGRGWVVVNGVAQSGEAPPVSAFLQAHQGAYTTTRTHSQALLLFWHRHLARLRHSVRLLADAAPQLLGLSSSAPPSSSSSLSFSFAPSLLTARALLLSHRRRHQEDDAELALTALVTASPSPSPTPPSLHVLLHLAFFHPPPFASSPARLAVAAPPRPLPAAKYSHWATLRQRFQNLRPPHVTEVLLSPDGDQLLEGSVTNFFVVSKVPHPQNQHPSPTHAIQVQTAAIQQGVLPGIIRQLVIEVCSEKGIPLTEVAPSWSQRDFWEEAFITSSLRIVQHVDSIQAPASYEDLNLKTWEDVSWVSRDFEGPGRITTLIQKEIMARAGREGYQMI